MNTIKIGTRGSQLALWQANHVADLLRQHYPSTEVELVTFRTKGDNILNKSLPSIGGKGLFTAELEAALLSQEINCAVHSLKDLPTINPDGLTIGAVPQRAAVEDVLISKHGITLEALPPHAAIGTSSLRRTSQLKHFRDDIEVIDIRGNVPKRIEKALDTESAYDAIVLARAGVERLNLMQHVSQTLSLQMMLPAPGQGAIAIQCRADKAHIFEKLTHIPTWLAVSAERAFLRQLDGGCSVPVAAYAYYADGTLHFTGRVASVDGQQWIEINQSTSIEEALHSVTVAKTLGREAAEEAIEKGANRILEAIR